MIFRRLRHRQPQARREFVVEGIGWVERDGCGGTVVIYDRPMNRRCCVIEKSAVLNQLGVKSAIVTVVDFLGHQPVENRADFSDGAVCIHRERRAVRETGGYSGCKNQERREFFHVLLSGEAENKKLLSFRSEEHTSELQSLRHL